MAKTKTSETIPMDNHFLNQESATHEGPEPVRDQERDRRKQDTKRQRVRATFMLPPDLKRRLRHYVADYDIEMSEVVEELLDEFLRSKGY